jgi:hypothetical protein
VDRLHGTFASIPDNWNGDLFTRCLLWPCRLDPDPISQVPGVGTKSKAFVHAAKPRTCLQAKQASANSELNITDLRPPFLTGSSNMQIACLSLARLCSIDKTTTTCCQASSPIYLPPCSETRNSSVPTTDVWLTLVNLNVDLLGNISGPGYVE